MTTANEQIESEVVVEKKSFRRQPDAEVAELVAIFTEMGLSPTPPPRRRRRSTATRPRP